MTIDLANGGLSALGLASDPLASKTETLEREAKQKARGGKVLEAAKQFESVVLLELMKAMRATIPRDEGDSFGLRMADDMLDQSVSEAGAGGLGLAPMLARELDPNSQPSAPTLRAPLVPSDGPSTAIGHHRHGGHLRDATPLPLLPPESRLEARPRAGAVAGLPQAGEMPVDGVLSSRYGWRAHPIDGDRKFHGGMDIAAEEGTEIHAVQAGRVRFAGKRGGYGNLVELAHADGTVTRYAHASRVHVREGDWVEVGEAVADVGSTGHATGPHLHFEVRKDGKTQNPEVYLRTLRARSAYNTP